MGGPPPPPRPAHVGGRLRPLLCFGSVLRAERLTLPLRSLYNNIKPPSWLPAGTDFHLFKAGIEPKWEDPQCEHGGKWTILVPKGAKQTIDKYWLHMVRLSKQLFLCLPVKASPCAQCFATGRKNSACFGFCKYCCGCRCA